MDKNSKNIFRLITKPDVFFFTLIWLMVILVSGTVAQKYIGLYQAQKIYFFSYILWAGPLPLPGGYTTMAVIFLNLFCKIFFASPWSWNRVGTFIVHMGALLLLTGGLLTAAMSKEGSMLIYEKAHSDYYSDYHDRELAIDNATTGESIISYPWKQLKVGSVLNVPGLPFHLEILKACRNCNVFPRKTPPDDPIMKELRGRAKELEMEAIPLEKDNEQNKSGVVFRISGASEDKNGIHFSVDFINVSPWVEVGDERYSIALRKKRTYLPFKIKLIDFQKQFHPGTEIPRSYQSEVILQDGSSEWHSLIRMNEPLRYKGYIFYQSSFIDTGDKEATILAVVKNPGRTFPYIASIVMCIGLLVHLFINLPKLIRKT